MPISPEDDSAVSGIVPLGEMIDHNAANGNPNGHEVFDFGLDRKVTVVAASDGRISHLNKSSSYCGYEVGISANMFYEIGYAVDEIAPGLHWGQSVKRGDIVGYAGEGLEKLPTGEKNKTIEASNPTMNTFSNPKDSNQK